MLKGVGRRKQTAFKWRNSSLARKHYMLDSDAQYRFSFSMSSKR